MIEPITYDINIALVNDKHNGNFFYQRFDDYAGNKVREVIRIVNEFPPEIKPWEFKPPISISLATLNAFTEEAQQASKISGSSLNAELVHIINRWIMQRT